MVSNPREIDHNERKALNLDIETYFVENKFNFDIMNLEISFNRLNNELPLLDFICNTDFSWSYFV